MIGEGLFYHVLAIVESAIDLKGRNVVAEGSELEFLDAADLAGRVENDDADSVDIVKAVGYCAAGIAGSGDEDGDGLVVVADEIAETAAHEPGADVFESKGGAMEEFEGKGRRGWGRRRRG